MFTNTAISLETYQIGTASLHLSLIQIPSSVSKLICVVFNVIMLSKLFELKCELWCLFYIFEPPGNRPRGSKTFSIGAVNPAILFFMKIGVERVYSSLWSVFLHGPEILNLTPALSEVIVNISENRLVGGEFKLLGPRTRISLWVGTSKSFESSEEYYMSKAGYWK